MTWQVSHAPLNRPITELGRFHAKWHRDAFLPTRPDRSIDWTLLSTQGRGRYVGTHLHGWNPIGGWWGEGDDKFFVDGEKFPSSFGTGSEDYFGYAWGSAKLFSRPYHNQILNEGNQGHFDDNRWHIPDSVPFQKSFEGDIEKYFLDQWGTLYSAVTYWYLTSNGTDRYAPASAAERVGYWIKPDFFYSEPNVLEAESLRPTNVPAVRPSAQIMLPSFGNGWSNERQMSWKGGVGDVLELPLPVANSGIYRVILRCTNAPDYGIARISLDGNPIGQPLDLYAQQTAPAAPADLGALELSAGQHKLTITIIGKNAASTGTTFGLDYVRLAPAQ
jgi:hypothetical protein